MSETQPVLANDPAARTETGEIINQGKPLIEPVKTETIVEAKIEEPAKEGETLLTKPEDKPEDKPKAEVPEKYEFKLPDGLTLTPEVDTEVQAMFKDLGVSQDGAQKLVDFYSKQVLAAAEAPQKLVNEMRQNWQKDVKADSAIGHKLNEVKSTISKAIDSLPMSKDFRAALDLTGAGDHPAIIKGLYAWAQTMTEGKHVSGNGPTKFGTSNPQGKPASAASAVYPHLP